jgi:hypothetical protein
MKSEDKHLFNNESTFGDGEEEDSSKKRRGGILGMDQKGGLKLVKA